jgi:plasmid stability protein
MAVLTLKNVPEELVERLKKEAKQNRRSLNQEALLRLEGSVAGRRRAAGEIIASLRRFHKRVAYLPPLTDEFLERAKRAGRA